MNFRRKCKECGQAFETNRTDRDFCSDACRKTWNNRRMTRGMCIYDAAMKFRVERDKGCFAELCTIIDRYAAEDREAKRKTYNARPPILTQR